MQRSLFNKPEQKILTDLQHPTQNPSRITKAVRSVVFMLISAPKACLDNQKYYFRCPKVSLDLWRAICPLKPVTWSLCLQQQAQISASRIANNHTLSRQTGRQPAWCAKRRESLFTTTNAHTGLQGGDHRNCSTCCPVLMMFRRGSLHSSSYQRHVDWSSISGKSATSSLSHAFSFQCLHLLFQHNVVHFFTRP